MSMINVPVLGSTDNLRRQLRTGVVSEIPHSPDRKTLRRSVRQALRPSSSHPHPHSPIVRDFAYRNNIHTKPNQRVEEAIPSHNVTRPTHTASDIVRRLRTSRDDPIADDKKNGAMTTIPLSERLLLRRSRRKPIPPPQPISFDHVDPNDPNINTHNNNRNREPKPIPSISPSAIRQRLAQMRFRQAQNSNPYPTPQPNIPNIRPGPDPSPDLPRNSDNLPDPPTLGRGFFGFPDKSRYFSFMRKNNGVPQAASVEPPPSRQVRFKSISSRIGRDAWRKNKAGNKTPRVADERERSHGSLPLSPVGAPVPREVSKSRIPPEARRGRVFGPNEVPNIDIHPPTPPLGSEANAPLPTAPLPTGPRPRSYGRMSMPAIRMPSVRVPKRLGFPWKKMGVGVNVGDGNGSGLVNRNTAAADERVMVQEQPRSIRQGRAPSLLQDRQPSSSIRPERTSSLVEDPPASVKQYASSIRQRSTSLQSSRPPSIQQAAFSSRSNLPSSTRPRATSLQSRQPPAIQQAAPSLHSRQSRPPSSQQPAPSLASRSNRPPSPGRPATSLRSTRPLSIRQRVTSLQSDRPPSPRNRQGQGQTLSVRAPTPAAAVVAPARPSTALSNPDRDPAARSSRSRSIILTSTTTKRGGHLTTLQLPMKMWTRNKNKMRMPDIRVFRKKGGKFKRVRAGMDVRRDGQLVKTSSRDRGRLTPSPVLIQQARPPTPMRVLLRATRPLLHPLLLTPTLLRPARLHWDVRDARLTQRGVDERLLKEPFITPTATSAATHDSLSLSIPIPIPLTAASSSFSPFASFTSLSKITSKNRANKYWTIFLPAFSSALAPEGTLIPPTVLQILTIISTALRVRATPQELAALYDERTKRYRREVEEVFRRRCEKEDGEREKFGTGTSTGRAKNRGGGRQERVGIRRVDLLGRKTRWLGLERGKDVEGWVVRLGNMNLR